METTDQRNRALTKLRFRFIDVEEMIKEKKLKSKTEGIGSLNGTYGYSTHFEVLVTYNESNDTYITLDTIAVDWKMLMMVYNRSFDDYIKQLKQVIKEDKLNKRNETIKNILND